LVFGNGEHISVTNLMHCRVLAIWC